jgi:hypothetical protein
LFVPPPQPRKTKVVSIEDEEKHIIRILLNYGCHTMEVPVLSEENEESSFEICVSEFILREVRKDQLELENPIYNEVLTIYDEHISRGEFPEERHFVNNEKPEIAALFADLMTTPYELSQNWVLKHKIYPETEEFKLLTEAQDRIRRLRLKKVQKMIDQVNSRMQAPELIDKDMENLMREKIRLDSAKTKLSAHFGTTIVV